MKKFKGICFGLMAIVLTVGVTACGASNRKECTTMDVAYSAEDVETGINGTDTVSEEESTASSSDISQTKVINTNQKLIRRVDMSLETLEFDALLKKIDSVIIQVNGYVESSSTYGNHINEDNMQQSTMTIRIPSDQLEKFTKLIGENTTIISQTISTQDVTMNYVDTESRKKALEIQKERLFALLEKAENMEDIIVLEQRISDITYELENYTSTLRTYDNLVDYSTVTLDIREVERESNPEPKNVWEKMGNGLSDSLYHIKSAFTSFVIWFVSSIPYLIIWALLISGGILIWRKKRVKKEADNKVSDQGNNSKSE